MTKYDPLGLNPFVKQEEERRKLLAEVEKNAYALDSSKDDAKKAAMTVEEQKRAQDEARKREIINAEPDVSKDILRVARTIDQIVNNQVFTTNVEVECQDKTKLEEYRNELRNYKAQVTVRDGLLEVIVSHKKRDNTTSWDHSLDDEEATVQINTEKDRIQLTYVVRDSTYSGKGKGLYRISRFFRKAPKAFKFLAEDSVKAENKGYIDDFISIYKIIPEILAKAIAKMSEEQEAKKKQLEREAARLEGRGLAEELTGSKGEEPKLLEKEFTYRQIRDIGEEIGLYSTKKRRKR